MSDSETAVPAPKSVEERLTDLEATVAKAIAALKQHFGDVHF